MAELRSCDRDLRPAEPKTFATGPLKKRVAGPWNRALQELFPISSVSDSVLGT